MTTDTQEPSRRQSRPVTTTLRSKKAGGSTISAGSALSPAVTMLDSPDSPMGSSFLASSRSTSPTQTADAAPDASIVAVHGSVPSSPALKAMGMAKDRGRSASYFNLPKPSTCHPGNRQGQWENKARTAGENVPMPADHEIVSPTAEQPKNLLVEIAETKHKAGEIPLPDPVDHVTRTANNSRVIAIDFDDVCAMSAAALCNEHNAKYGTDLTSDDIETYALYQNKGWGSQVETQKKLNEFGAMLHKTLPMPGLASAVKHIRALGHPVHIVTARPESEREAVIQWLGKLDLTVGTGEEVDIAAIWFTDAYAAHRQAAEEAATYEGSPEDAQKLMEKRMNDVVKSGAGHVSGGHAKLAVLRAINAALFIDDYHGNLDPILESEPHIQCLLFGDYKWNKSRIGVSSPIELMSYDQRIDAGAHLTKEDVHIRGWLARAHSWEQVIDWIKRWDVPKSE